MGICSSKINHPRKGITNKQALIIYDRCRAQCFYCLKDIAPFAKRKYRWEVDHMNPVYLNGESSLDNYIAACYGCNQNKKKKLVNVWLTEKNWNRRCIWVLEDFYCGAECASVKHKYCLAHQVQRFL
jgi:5-methylcytosine-specific restriction endonuclease McrA